MGRYGRRGSGGDGADLQARLDALRSSEKRKRRGGRRGGVVPVALGVVLLAGVLAAVYFIYATATGSAAGGAEAAEGPARVEVVSGDTLDTVAAKLDRAGVVQSAFLFKLEARVEGHDTGIQTGRYTFGPEEGTDEILRKLTVGVPAPTSTLSIPEGLTLQETAERVAADTGVSAGAFEEAAKTTDYGYAFLEDPAVKNTEGYLFPSQYEVEEGTTAGQIVNRLLGQYLIETGGLDVAGAGERLGLTEHELVTVAALIEKESASTEERPLVASVIYNRLQKGMPLQIDASIQYALAEPKAELSLADLKVDSPYNTYENEGLPPGPICSPSRDSLRAATQPAETDYLYYVLKANGREHFFTRSYDEFLEAKRDAGR